MIIVMSGKPLEIAALISKKSSPPPPLASASPPPTEQVRSPEPEAAQATKIPDLDDYIPAAMLIVVWLFIAALILGGTLWLLWLLMQSRVQGQRDGEDSALLEANGDRTSYSGEGVVNARVRGSGGNRGEREAEGRRKTDWTRVL